ncbi:MAG: glycosyltransferase, partial [Myxococcota bacterium]|nr:glycosyltransferase [Myxococcota bacterium]
HVHHLSGLSLGLVTATRAVGVPVVLTLHDYAIPCARGQLVDRDLQPCPGPSVERCAVCLREHLELSAATRLAGRLLSRVPQVRSRARNIVGQLPPSDQTRDRVSARMEAVQGLLNRVDIILSPSEDLANRFESLGFPRPRTCSLPLVRPVPPAPHPGTGPVRFLFLGSVIPTKGPALLLEAFGRLHPGTATLSLAGPAPPYDGQPDFAARLRDQARVVPGVTWLGEIAPQAVSEVLHAHDVLVLPSTWPENSPLVVREATAAGLRVVASRHGGTRELDPEARLVAAGDVEALHRALVSELEQGRERRCPLSWTAPMTHAEALISEVYAPLHERATTSRTSG